MESEPCCSWKEVFELVAIGDAQLAKAVKNKVFSLDLVACDDSVIACNMAHGKMCLRSRNTRVVDWEQWQV